MGLGLLPALAVVVENTCDSGRQLTVTSTNQHIILYDGRRDGAPGGARRLCVPVAPVADHY